MNLSDLALLLDARPLGPAFAPEAHVTRVSYDARDIGAGTIFAAVNGTHVDGHNFIVQAANNGAVAALVDREWAQAQASQLTLPVFAVENTREAMARLAVALCGDPSHQLKLVGVTGTNGKTTTTSLTQSLLEACHIPTGLLGTLGAFFRETAYATGFTTPQSPELQTLLEKMVVAGAQVVAMEVSSHAIAQERIYGCAFETVVFTNLTQDHLDYHLTMDKYAAAKRRLFDASATGEAPRHAIINLDDPLGESFVAATSARVMTYGLQADKQPTLLATNLTAGAAGCTFDLHYAGQSIAVSLPLPGRFNVSNALAAIGVGLSMGVDLSALVAALATVPGVAGRAEVVTPPGHAFTAWVDYAHTPDGLENVLLAARALSPTRLIVVFGCGGDRDRTKRPMMGEVASRLADIAIVTSDNPRSEDPAAIIAEIVPAMRGNFQVKMDRHEAIAAAVRAARPGDLIVVAGKGHETTQTFADKTVHFDDREVTRHWVGELSDAC